MAFIEKYSSVARANIVLHLTVARARCFLLHLTIFCTCEHQTTFAVIWAACMIGRALCVSSRYLGVLDVPIFQWRSWRERGASRGSALPTCRLPQGSGDRQHAWHAPGRRAGTIVSDISNMRAASHVWVQLRVYDDCLSFIMH